MEMLYTDDGKVVRVAIPIPSGEGQNVGLTDFRLAYDQYYEKSQYLYLLVKVRT